MSDYYDPQGEAAIWAQAAKLAMELKQTDDPGNPQWEQWNAALDQAARVIENEARAVRQRNGMYYRVITGQGGATPGNSS